MNNILTMLVRWLKNYFFISEEEMNELEIASKIAINKANQNFQYSDNKYFRGYNRLHSVMNMIFRYYLSNELYKRNQCPGLCDKIYYLNKIMHSVDLFYAIELPQYFSAEHPLGSVMGRAKYSDGFFFYQGCTVGGTKDKTGNIHYPEIEENCHMFANSSILGKCHIGKNVNIGAGAIVKNQDIPDNCTVFGQSPNLIIKKNYCCPIKVDWRNDIRLDC
ncbi:MAG: transferase [Muribaculaceae bacterium]|nr:transferase [Muribaculaceae bacterium]